MSPLTPQITKKIDKSTSTNIDNAPGNLVEAAQSNSDTMDRSYTPTYLHELRHNQSRAPNLSNRSVLDSISRACTVSETNQTNQTNQQSSFSMNIMRSAMDQMRTERERRLQDSHRQPDMRRHDQRRPSQRYARNGGCPSNGAEVKLSEAANAWKPSHLQGSIENKDETNELCKKVRLILKKLTDSNFGVLSEHFRQLQIDTKAKLNEVIGLVFNKAVNEPNFSECYAKLSEHLSQCSQKIDSSIAETAEKANFKRTLITKCQSEFEQNVANTKATEDALEPLMTKLKQYEENADTKSADELRLQIAEKESILRRRLVSTIRFIGELYKLNMLTSNIMGVCISTLIRETASVRAVKSDLANEKIECLCKLLTTIGKKLETKSPNSKDKSQQLDLTSPMDQLRSIANNKVRSFKPSSRIKFMILDLIDLRKRNWEPKNPNVIPGQTKHF